ncbi:unnamed protein product [Rotaria sp. Silwood2]|nr:unnamed protein product [Rotaria sp. Silwood2]CAF2878436.1 unnamed protein product [Rotaria sp. Silwood2]CAF2989617.1 unnamed protein product [Rotaria sp. Silwood2]CAF3310165.1 unnamed protein product [Rotaria sp. Silwood2]CAF4178850.1 unnamed protein product [Rotaria sp. Silwood2]
MLCKTKQSNNELLSNPYYAYDNSSIPEYMINIIYKQDLCNLRFLIWENPNVTWIILHEIIGSAFEYSMKKKINENSSSPSPSPSPPPSTTLNNNNNVCLNIFDIFLKI